jgi:hypothetical protein
MDILRLPDIAIFASFLFQLAPVATGLFSPLLVQSPPQGYAHRDPWNIVANPAAAAARIILHGYRGSNTSGSLFVHELSTLVDTVNGKRRPS